jgi:protein-L-isoaspartate(D-aspartate) O-methyltransferase
MIFGAVACVGCGQSDEPGTSHAPSARVPHDVYAASRIAMVDEQIAARGIDDPRVLAALAAEPRHLFVPPDQMAAAYDDTPLPIGFGQTISQPFIVAYMTEALNVMPGHRVLEIGTGSGYQAAVLARLAKAVYTVEIVPALANRARQILRELGHDNAWVRTGDGYAGWPEHAPFDRIIVTAAPDRVPQPLVDQLAVGGRLIAPVGTFDQQLVILTKTPEGITSKPTIDVRFVPLVRGRR